MYTGPKQIVIVGGGIAGITAFDAITEGLASVPVLPAGFSVTLVEGTAGLGGRATSEPIAGPTPRHPFAPHDVTTPHGIHFVWGSYDHTYRLMGPALSSTLVPAVGTETYCLWLAPPDIPGDGTTEGRVVGLHVCDPRQPERAWQPPARRILRAFERASVGARVIEEALLRLFDIRISSYDLLSYVDVLFDEEHIGPELRWTMLLTGALTATMGAPETSLTLRALLGKHAQDAEIGELTQPLWSDWVRRKLENAARLLAPVGLVRGEAIAGSVAPDAGPPTSLFGRLRNDAQALSDIVGLISRDAARIATRGGFYDPRRSGYTKNILKAAFSSPYGLDVATSVRDAQFGVQNHAGSRLQLFDGDESRAVWDAIAARAEARSGAGFLAEIKRARVVSEVELDAGTGRVLRVHLSDTVDRAPPDVPMLRPATPGPTVETLDADVVTITTMPACIPALLPGAPAAMLARLTELGRYANDTINLQVFLPRPIALPFPTAPVGSPETPPFGISNLEGPFTILVDLQRGWSPAKYRAVRLDAADPPDSFAGAAWELVGSYADFFTHDEHAHAARYQWPLAVQQQLANLLHDPSVMDPSALDTRPWVHDTGAPGRLPPPILGEVLASHRAAYQAAWQDQAGPIVVCETLRQIAAMPGVSSVDATYLREQAALVASGMAHEVKWILIRNAHAENRFFSAEPGIFQLRPHARFETDVPGLWLAGDWTRNGLNVQAMEPTVISGLQAAAGILEEMRGAGLDVRALPRIDPLGVLPDGAWDAGPTP